MPAWYRSAAPPPSTLVSWSAIRSTSLRVCAYTSAGSAPGSDSTLASAPSVLRPRESSMLGLRHAATSKLTTGHLLLYLLLCLLLCLLIRTYLRHEATSRTCASPMLSCSAMSSRTWGGAWVG